MPPQSPNPSQQLELSPRPRPAPARSARKPVPHNRLQIVMIHAPRYAFQGQARLAKDAGVSRSTISRLLYGQTAPSLHLAQAVTAALSRRLKCTLDTADLFSPDGAYREPSGCALCGCAGCLPEAAYDPRGNRRPEWRNARPGEWSRFPQAPGLTS